MRGRQICRAVGVLMAGCAGVARAAPKGLLPMFPMQNSTNATDAACEAKCSVYYPQLTGIQWVPEDQIVYTTKILVGTISVIITVANVNGEASTIATATQTVLGWVPPEYSFFQTTTNEAGTSVFVVPIATDLADGTTFLSLTYPTPYIDYPSEYQWEGIVPTHDKGFHPACATATEGPANAPLDKHPEYPQPKDLTPGKDDPLGVGRTPIWVPLKDDPDKAFFDAAFPSVSAFSYCESMTRATPLPTIFSAPKFVYESTTVFTEPHSEGIIHFESTQSGWEEQATTTEIPKTPNAPHLESTVDGWEERPSTRRDTRPTTVKPDISSKPSSQQAPKIESTADGFSIGRPGAQQTARPEPEQPQPQPQPGDDKPPTFPEVIVSIIVNNPDAFSPKPQDQQPQITRPPANPRPAVPTPAAQNAKPTPVFTFVPTVINGQSTKVPAFILPSSSATATLGQTVTLDAEQLPSSPRT
ncbi:hypothetical protein BDV95DRAFT_217613 [Massariosphaeria phaeospora]|uniref:Uncharacterized protein n=1 Tax=Massariosphaeria phaeospora TaxID=100035 RepID=A0A7C8ICD3_9PLEO|nr:hypothetical protein BDV95DRAFT_217613 [Massariosphaeria phaeospora]